MNGMGSWGIAGVHHGDSRALQLTESTVLVSTLSASYLSILLFGATPAYSAPYPSFHPPNPQAIVAYSKLDSPPVRFKVTGPKMRVNHISPWTISITTIVAPPLRLVTGTIEAHSQISKQRPLAGGSNCLSWTF